MRLFLSADPANGEISDGPATGMKGEPALATRAGYKQFLEAVNVRGTGRALTTDAPRVICLPAIVLAPFFCNLLSNG